MIINDESNFKTFYIDDDNAKELKELNDEQFLHMVNSGKILIDDRDNATRNQIANRIDTFIITMQERFSNEKDENGNIQANNTIAKLIYSDAPIIKQTGIYSLIYNNYEYSVIILDNVGDKITTEFIAKLIATAYEYNEEHQTISDEDFLHNVDCSLFLAIQATGVADRIGEEYEAVVDAMDKDDKEKEMVKKTIKVILQNNFSK